MMPVLYYYTDTQHKTRTQTKRAFRKTRISFPKIRFASMLVSRSAGAVAAHTTLLWRDASSPYSARNGATSRIKVPPPGPLRPGCA